MDVGRETWGVAIDNRRYNEGRETWDERRGTGVRATASRPYMDWWEVGFWLLILRGL